MSEPVITVQAQWSEHWWRTMKTGYWVCGQCGLTWPLIRVKIRNAETGHTRWEAVDAYPR